MSDENNGENLDSLIKTRRCKYPSCEAEISAESQFDYCEKCRALAARNAVGLLIDPCAPSELERFGAVQDKLLHELTGEEILRAVDRVEKVYLAMKKLIMVNNIVSSNKKPFKSMQEQIEEARNIAAESDSRRRAKKTKETGPKLTAQQKRIADGRKLIDPTGKKNLSDSQILEILGEDSDEEIEL